MHVYIAFLLALIYSVNAQDNPCEGVFNGNVPHPDFCYKYYSCLMTFPTERTCGENTIFTTTTHSCVPGNQDTCEIYSTESTTLPNIETTTYVETTTSVYVESTTSAPEVNLNEICKGVFFAARPYPDSIHLYIGCMRGSGIIYQCLDKEEFDEDVNECVRICEVPDDVCAGSPLVRVIENPCTCSGFIVCYDQRVIDTRLCGEGNIFDVEHG